MPGSYLIDLEQGLVFSRGWGVLTDDELHWHAETLAADLRRDSRRAVIVPSDLIFGLTRMFEAHINADQNQFRVFRALGPAFEWVGVDPAAAWPAREPDAVVGVPLMK
jgi:hypothetical protein